MVHVEHGRHLWGGWTVEIEIRCETKNSTVLEKTSRQGCDGRHAGNGELADIEVRLPSFHPHQDFQN